MKILDAIEQVLRKHGNGQPMHYKRITDIAIEEGLFVSSGLTPEASFAAQLSVDIRRRQEAGDDERFVSYGSGLYGLATARASTQLEDSVRKHNEDVKLQLLRELTELDPRAFEDLVARLLATLGFEDVEVTSYSGDFGIDVRGTLAVGGVTNVTTAIQVKRWKPSNKVPGKTVRELRGGLGPHERGLIIATSDFTKDARTEAEMPNRTPISLVNGRQLVELLCEHEIGVVGKVRRVLSLDVASLQLAETEIEAEAVSTKAGIKRPASAGTKRSGIWPLPGGKTKYVETMTDMLRFAAKSEPTLGTFVAWMMSTYPKVNSEKSATSYVGVLRQCRLVQTDGDRLRITESAARYLDSENPDDLYDAMNANVIGFEETLDFLRRGPASAIQVADYLNEKLALGWTSIAQPSIRLDWLISFGKVRKDGKNFVSAD